MSVLSVRRRLIYLYVSVGNVSKREEVQIKKQESICEMLTLVETTSKTTLDLRGDFIYLFSFFSKIKFLFHKT